MRRIPSVLVVAASMIGLVVSCSSGDSAAPDVSGVSMVDVATGEQTLLGEALDAPPSTPLVAWFWAPH